MVCSNTAGVGPLFGASLTSVELCWQTLGNIKIVCSATVEDAVNSTVSMYEIIGIYHLLVYIISHRHAGEEPVKRYGRSEYLLKK